MLLTCARARVDLKVRHTQGVMMLLQESPQRSLGSARQQVLGGHWVLIENPHWETVVDAPQAWCQEVCRVSSLHQHCQLLAFHGPSHATQSLRNLHCCMTHVSAPRPFTAERP